MKPEDYVTWERQRKLYEVRIEAAKIVQNRHAGAWTQITGAPKSVEEFLKDCQKVAEWIENGAK